MKLLIVEDDHKLAQNLKSTLEEEGFAVDTVETQEQGLIQLEVNEYDCIILDLNLPDGSGFNLLTQIREQKNITPTIIATARGEIDDRVKGLNLGADDYVPKPIDTTELVARIRAVIRRSKNNPLPEINVGQLKVKPNQHQATINNQNLDLTAKEFAVLEYLAMHSGQVVTRTMLMEHIWGSDFDSFSNVIDVYIRNLRRKLEQHSSKELIKTIRGKGYILNA